MATRAAAPKKTPTRRNGREGAAVRERGVSTANNAGAVQVQPDKPLTEQQRAFVRHLATGESTLTASLKAGYSDNGTYAYRMLHMPNIQLALQEEQRKYAEASGMTRKAVLEGFQEAIQLAKMVEEPSSMIAGWREIAKVCGFYEPAQIKITHTHEGKVLHERVEKLSDDELMKLIEERANAIRGLPAPGDAGQDTDGAGA